MSPSSREPSRGVVVCTYLYTTPCSKIDSGHDAAIGLGQRWPTELTEFGHSAVGWGKVDRDLVG